MPRYPEVLNALHTTQAALELAILTYPTSLSVLQCSTTIFKLEVLHPAVPLWSPSAAVCGGARPGASPRTEQARQVLHKRLQARRGLEVRARVIRVPRPSGGGPCCCPASSRITARTNN